MTRNTGKTTSKNCWSPNATSDLEGLFDKLQGELKDFRGDAPIGDDVTLLILRRNSA